MRTLHMKLVGLAAFGAASLSLAAGCAEPCSAGFFGQPSVEVLLEPNISSTYDVQVVIADSSGGFRCELSEGKWLVTNESGVFDESGGVEGPYSLFFCDSSGFAFTHLSYPKSIEVEAADGSWLGSESAPFDYSQVSSCGASFDDRAEVTVRDRSS